MKKILLFCLIFTLNNYYVLAQNLIQNLPQSTIIVRLQTNEHIINYHREQGHHHLANKEKIKQTKKNREIIKTFTEDWDFCPVYFFYSNYSKEIINKNFEHVFKNNEDYNLSNEEKTKLKKDIIIMYFGQTQGKLKFDALVLNDSKIQQLKKPYPKFIRTYKGLGFLKRNTKKIVRILNQKISWHYDNK
tara:strand:- start:1969 stop:2535 length:567 start_codon:yes stop_codon:yes gene_type:complete